MAWISTIDPDEAGGLLAKLYRAARERAGKVFGVIRLQSLRPHVLRASTQLYVELMLSPRGALPRRQREMLATTVSWANACDY